MLIECVQIDVEHLVRGGVPPESRCVHDRAARQPVTEGRSRNDLPDALGVDRGIVTVHQQPGPAVGDRSAQPADIRGDDRRAACLRLDSDQAERLGV